MSRPKPTRLATIVGVLGLGWVTAHFAATLLHLAPTSLIGLSLGGVESAYIFPLFTQKWALFAPDPPLQNRSFHYKCVDTSGEETTWMGSLEGLTEQHQKHRFTPSSYLKRIEGAAMRNVLGGQTEFLDQYVQKAALDEEENEVLVGAIAALALKNLQDVARERQIAYRVAMYHCKNLMEDTVAVRVRSTWSDIPKFSLRNDDTTPVVNAFTLPWGTPAKIVEMVEKSRETSVDMEGAREMIRQVRESNKAKNDDATGTSESPMEDSDSEPKLAI